MDIKTVLQKEFRLSKVQVNNIVDLIDAGTLSLLSPDTVKK